MWSWLWSQLHGRKGWIATAPKGRSRQKAGLEARFQGLTVDDGRAAKRSAIHPEGGEGPAWRSWRSWREICRAIDVLAPPGASLREPPAGVGVPLRNTCATLWTLWPLWTLREEFPALRSVHLCTSACIFSAGGVT
jgi:hypothetical protein